MMTLAEYMAFMSEGSYLLGGVVVAIYVFAALVGKYS